MATASSAYSSSWIHVLELPLWLDELSFDVTGATERWEFLTHERKRSRKIRLAPSVRPPFSHWWGLHGAEAPVGPLTHPSEEEGGSARLFFFVFRFCLGTEAERGPAGYAATVGLHPRVWRLGLHWRVRERRRHARDGEKETKRRKFFNEVCKQFPFALRSRGGLLLEKLRLQFIVGAQASVFPASSMEQVWLFFLMMHREGWAKQMKTRTVHIIGRYFLSSPCTFWTIAVLGCPCSCQCLACMGEFLQWNPSWGTVSLCSAIAEQRRAGLYYWQPAQNGTRLVSVILAGNVLGSFQWRAEIDAFRLDLINDARV